MTASNLLSFEDALAQLLANAVPLAPTLQLPLAQARGRVLAADLVTPVDVPPLDNSAMDGYALRAADAPVDGTRLPVTQRIAAGQVGTDLAPGSAARIFTGAPVPVGADCVVMQEQCRVDGDAVVIERAPRAGQNVRRRGEDMRSGSVVLHAGTRLNAAHLGVAAASGAAHLTVYRAPRVALFSTGDELVLPGTPPEHLAPGAIYNSNRSTLQALIEGAGGEVVDLGVVEDSFDATRAALREAAQRADVVLSSGGVSVGEEDHVKPAVEAEGALDLWKIAIKPGKPLAYGHLRRDDGSRAAFVGLPGNPVSSFVTFVTLVRPFLLALQGCRSAPVALALRAEFDWPPAGKLESRREFLRARRSAEGGVELYDRQGSGVLTSCAWSDGLVDNAPNQTIRRGDVVRFIPFECLGV